MPIQRVLIVEDEPLIGLLVKDLLEELGFEAVGPVASVKQALALIDAHPPAAVLLDLSLGREESYPIADILVAKRIPFALSTGRDGRGIADRHAGAVRLVKPFDASALKAVMDSLLGRSTL